jgi:hypothetical protein
MQEADMGARSVWAGVLILGLIAAAPTCWGQSSVEQFIQADLAAHQATIAGMEQRLMVMNAGSVDPALDAELSEQIEQSVAAVFSLYGFTASAHAAFAQKHAREIEEWLEAHPDTVTTYGELQSRVQALIDALDSAAARLHQ